MNGGQTGPGPQSENQSTSILNSVRVRRLRPSRGIWALSIGTARRARRTVRRKSTFVLKNTDCLLRPQAEKIRAKGKAVDFATLLTMEPDGGTTNVRNTKSSHWMPWMGVDNRCLVPFTRFAELDPAAKVEGGRTPNAWFALDGAGNVPHFSKPLGKLSCRTSHLTRM